ncbi:MAG: hypothetical protein ACTSX6_03310 [Candidatus Heimdallarchaeaceae archaeon]
MDEEEIIEEEDFSEPIEVEEEIDKSVEDTIESKRDFEYELEKLKGEDVSPYDFEDFLSKIKEFTRGLSLTIDDNMHEVKRIDRDIQKICKHPYLNSEIFDKDPWKNLYEKQKEINWRLVNIIIPYYILIAEFYKTAVGKLNKIMSVYKKASESKIKYDTQSKIMNEVLEHIKLQNQETMEKYKEIIQTIQQQYEKAREEDRRLIQSLLSLKLKEEKEVPKVKPIKSIFEERGEEQEKIESEYQNQLTQVQPPQKPEQKRELQPNELKLYEYIADKFSSCGNPVRARVGFLSHTDKFAKEYGIESKERVREIINMVYDGIKK